MHVFFLRGNATYCFAGVGLALAECAGSVRGTNQNHGKPEGDPQTCSELRFFAPSCCHFFCLLIRRKGSTGIPAESQSAVGCIAQPRGVSQVTQMGTWVRSWHTARYAWITSRSGVNREGCKALGENIVSSQMWPITSERT